MKAKSFVDGVVKMYTITNTAVSGMRPTETATLKYTIRYKDEKVGITRAYQALQAKVNIKAVISVPIKTDISTQDVAVINQQQYKIQQVQHDKNTTPKTTLLTLVEAVSKYDIN